LGIDGVFWNQHNVLIAAFGTNNVLAVAFGVSNNVLINNDDALSEPMILNVLAATLGIS
jgi:hypothetical protein